MHEIKIYTRGDLHTQQAPTIAVSQPVPDSEQVPIRHLQPNADRVAAPLVHTPAPAGHKE